MSRLSLSQLDAEQSVVYRRLDLELSESAGVSVKKTRRSYPLVVALGVERIERLAARRYSNARRRSAV